MVCVGKGKGEDRLPRVGGERRPGMDRLLRARIQRAQKESKHPCPAAHMHPQSQRVLPRVSVRHSSRDRAVSLDGSLQVNSVFIINRSISVENKRLKERGRKGDKGGRGNGEGIRVERMDIKTEGNGNGLSEDNRIQINIGEKDYVDDDLREAEEEFSLPGSSSWIVKPILEDNHLVWLGPFIASLPQHNGMLTLPDLLPFLDKVWKLINLNFDQYSFINQAELALEVLAVVSRQPVEFDLLLRSEQIIDEDYPDTNLSARILAVMFTAMDSMIGSPELSMDKLVQWVERAIEVGVDTFPSLAEPVTAALANLIEGSEFLYMLSDHSLSIILRLYLHTLSTLPTLTPPLCLPLVQSLRRPYISNILTQPILDSILQTILVQARSQNSLWISCLAVVMDEGEGDIGKIGVLLARGQADDGQGWIRKVIRKIVNVHQSKRPVAKLPSWDNNVSRELLLGMKTTIKRYGESGKWTDFELSMDMISLFSTYVYSRTKGYGAAFGLQDVDLHIKRFRKMFTSSRQFLERKELSICLVESLDGVSAILLKG